MRRRTGSALALAAALTLSFAPAAQAAERPVSAAGDELGDVQAAVDALARTPGVLAVIGEARVDGRLVGSGSAGSRLRDGKGGKVPPGARYRAGSQTKLMIAVAVLQLVKEGKLGLDDKVGKLLPQVRRGAIVQKANSITVRHLLRHTSGIPDWGGKIAADPDRYFFKDVDRHHSPLEVVKLSRGLPRTGAPGERFSYSNTNFTLLGMIVEKVTGRSLRSEIDRRIFKPLRMTRSYLATKPGIKGTHAHSYMSDASGKLHDVSRLNPSFGGAAGGVISTARDLSTFARAFRGGKLLPPKLMKVLSDPPEGMPEPPPGPQPCAGTQVGSFPGYISATATSNDGRRQFAFSITLSGPDKVRRDVLDKPGLLQKAAESVICPGAS
ncbi:serine hydrolase domain-containing protein [Nonomuraea endophytica]|uniref:D-alanyl-D-alanine carboxypeptidase n=1 Tax=Nonomuraea endophytica TaxID=714136 RepID=A0A7W8EDA7_9ACTN|nr:serine hydrolase domain-containing protein [Nonomuraea endophytica]MBB5076360.1 D-alanyl-D-alanine carboxypeptidase [Nonomuraea endophytica]